MGPPPSARRQEEEGASAEVSPSSSSINSNARACEAPRSSPRESAFVAARGLLGGLGAGALFAAVQSTTLKRPPGTFVSGAVLCFVAGFSVTAGLTFRSQQKHKRGLQKLQRQHIKSMRFMDMQSLAPPLPPDAATAEGEAAAEKLLQQDAQRRRGFRV